MATTIETFHNDTTDLFGSNTTEERNEKIKTFLPPNIVIDPELLIKNVSISSQTSSNGPVYKYVIEWSEKTDKTFNQWKDFVIPANDQITKTTTTTTTTTITENNTKSLEKSRKSVQNLVWSKMQTSNAVVICDGPCQKKVALANVVQFGCDHLICDNCLRSEKSAPLFDGSPGCCNIECVQIARNNGEKLRCGPTLSKTSSISSMNGPWESLQVHVIILRKVRDNVIKSQLVYEFSSQARASSLVNTLYSYDQFLKEARIYYANEKPVGSKHLKPISLMDTNLRFYDLTNHDAPFTSELWFICVGKGIRL